LKLRARLLTKSTQRQELIQQAFLLQSQINDKHETLRELLLTERKRSGRSHYDEKHLLIFISSVNIFELIEAKHVNYDDLDRLFSEKNYLEAPKSLNKVMSEDLMVLAECLNQNNRVPDNKRLFRVLSNSKNTIATY